MWVDVYGKKLIVFKVGREMNVINFFFFENLLERGIDFLEIVFGFYE